MKETHIGYQLTLHPDSRAQQEILDLVNNSGKSCFLHPLTPFILLREEISPILYPLERAIPSPPKPILFDFFLQESEKSYLTSGDNAFELWRRNYSGFLMSGTIESFTPIEVVDWRGRITRMEYTQEAGRIIRYRWDILHEFHLA
ncbi:MAG: hypothetical protein JXK93_00780 [Sphaerochaetaceae bacterium]|nr:hypothetical protein [Sphaerochaetaceae bacterium]